MQIGKKILGFRNMQEKLENCYLLMKKYLLLDTYGFFLPFGHPKEFNWKSFPLAHWHYICLAFTDIISLPYQHLPE